VEKKQGDLDEDMKDWKSLLRDGYSNVEQMKDILKFGEEELQTLKEIQKKFPMFINPYYMSLMDPEDPEDPIRKMSIPGMMEASRLGSFDTSGEQSNTVMPGLQHKYKETALILSTNRCAMYCRHCFRKRLVGVSEDEVFSHFDEIVRYIRDHKEISNVLVSGGDAFMNSNEMIGQILELLTDIEHLDLIRFGTRMPVVLPQRITTDPDLLDLLRKYESRKQICVVTQFNHPKEITTESTAAVKMLLETGIPVRNQTVLLKGVNDDAYVLGTLLRKLTRTGVIPYYIFQCRPVTGVMSSFQVPLKKAYSITAQALQMQNGQGKCCRFVLSHQTGKIEALGIYENGEMLFKYHQAKDPADAGRIFTKEISDDQCWL